MVFWRKEKKSEDNWKKLDQKSFEEMRVAMEAAVKSMETSQKEVSDSVKDAVKVINRATSEFKKTSARIHQSNYSSERN